MRLEAADGLALELWSERMRIEWGEPDWLGPLGLELRAGGALCIGGSPPSAADAKFRRAAISFESFEGEDDLGPFAGARIDGLPHGVVASARASRERAWIAFRLEATQAVAECATGDFALPAAAWPAFAPRRRDAGGAPEGVRSYAHQYTEFALPIFGDACAEGFVLHRGRPLTVSPLAFVAPGGRTLLLAPLDAFHEQVIAIPREEGGAAPGVRCGWHGDLAALPAGFASECVLLAAADPRQALDLLCEVLLRRYGVRRPDRYADPLLAKLSYWTDNGAAYYYRTEPGCDVETTLARAVDALDAEGLPVEAVQIDSWFYPHENTRAISPEGAPIVPPSGLLAWEPRADAFPRGLGGLRARLGGRPLVFHSRHFSSASKYFERFAAWQDGACAHPADPDLFEVLMEQAAAWGACTYEQDWLVESFVRVRGLRELPGRAAAWQAALDRAAGRRGLTLQWCMATPADFFETLRLAQVTSIRTSGDYRYLFDNGANWVWFLHGNALARALGLWPFKDLFLSHPPTARGIGEPYAEAEALLAALSAGPVGIGDQIGATRREIVRRTCREDGVLVKPDLPIAAIPRCFTAPAFFEHEPLVGETWSAHPAGRWIYVASFNASRQKKPLDFRVELAELGAARPDGPVVWYDWRSGRHARLPCDGGYDLSLEFQDWHLAVLCPVLPCGLALFGDTSLYATAGDRRIGNVRADAQALELDVLGVPGALVEVEGVADAAPAAWTAGPPGASGALAASADPAREGYALDPRDGRFRLRVRVGRDGHTHVRIERGGGAARPRP